MVDKNISMILVCDPIEKAIELRKNGKSLRDISAEVDIPYSTIRLLLKDIYLTDEQKKQLLSKRKKLNEENITIKHDNNKIQISGKLKIKYPVKYGRPKKEDILNYISNFL